MLNMMWAITIVVNPGDPKPGAARVFAALPDRPTNRAAAGGASGALECRRKSLRNRDHEPGLERDAHELDGGPASAARGDEPRDRVRVASLCDLGDVLLRVVHAEVDAATRLLFEAFGVVELDEARRCEEADLTLRRYLVAAAGGRGEQEP